MATSRAFAGAALLAGGDCIIELRLRGSAMTEPEIIRRAQTGNVAAFEHLYRAHKQRVYAICFRMTGNAAVADDLTQDAFLQVFCKIHTFRSESALSTWLYRLTVNVVLINRRRRSVKETSLEETHEMDEGENSWVSEIGRTNQYLSGVVDGITLEGGLETQNQRFAI